MFKKRKPKSFYADIESAGSLGQALQLEFTKLQSKLSTEKPKSLEIFPDSFTIVQNGNKLSQIYLAKEERLFLPDFWRNGVCLAHGKSDNLTRVAEAIDFWLNNDIKTSQLSHEFPFIEAENKAEAFDNGTEIEYAWNNYLEHPSLKNSGMSQFIKEAIKHEKIKNLFPFISLERFCFSRCTGYPYTRDLPVIVVLEKKDFYVLDNDGNVLQKGTIEEAIKTLLEQIPPDIKRAKSVTAEML